VHFGIPKPPDAGVLVAVLGDVDDVSANASARPSTTIQRRDAAG
jgi:hypothetical protein